MIRISLRQRSVVRPVGLEPIKCLFRIAGILLLAFPRESARTMAILAGASLVVDGIQTVVYHLSGRKPKDKNAPIETTDYEDKT